MVLKDRPGFIDDLQTDCRSHTDIGRKFGVTKERVRQLALKLLNQTGRQKQRTCTIKRAVPLNGEFSPVIRWVWSQARHHGYTVEKIVRTHNGAIASPCRLIINGYNCKIHYAKTPFKTCDRSYRSYFRFAPIKVKDNLDGFSILVIPFSESWSTIILPNSILDGKHIYIPANKQYSNYNKTFEHVKVNWLDYMDRWDLLERKEND